jgi:hypothetical protein
MTTSTATERGTYVALIYALVAERLTVHYEHGQWLTKAQGASLAADWLSRQKRSLPIEIRKHLSELSDELARQIAGTLSREAGLHTAHEMMESLDPKYQSDITPSLMLECERMLDNNPLAQLIEAGRVAAFRQAI